MAGLHERIYGSPATGNRAGKIENKKPTVIWMHCASTGEFEQGRPVLEQLKNNREDVKIILTFFSPSGYEAYKDYKDAHQICYLPMDGKANAEKFIDAVGPTLVLWVKYEYWYYYLSEIKSRNIPLLLVSGIFRANQPFFKWYGKVWRQMLVNFTHLFVQNEGSKQLLKTIGITQQVSMSGDTRFDRVIEIARQVPDFPIIHSFCQGRSVLVAGSTWEDDDIILSAYADETGHREKIILVPHEINKNRLPALKKLFKRSVCYTELEKEPALLNSPGHYDTLIMDTTGMLSRLYYYGDINYVGGGFTSDGVHNVLEAAVWGKPLILGENYDKYFEAVDLVNCLAAESISDTNELKAIMDIFINDRKAYEEAAMAAKKYVYGSAGASGNVIEFINRNKWI
jgi:3-deoxy-D-manno-octulosonic-acid transferase